MIVRLIVFMAIFVIGWWLYRQYSLFKSKSSAQTAKKQSQDSQENMVRCEQCQIFIPISDALTDAKGRTFCSQEHKAQFNQQD